MKTISTLFLVLLIFHSSASGRDAARDMRRMVGYTILAADTVDKVLNGKFGEKYIRLSGGAVFKVEMLLLDPLPLTDVIIFVKPPSQEIIAKFSGKVPDLMLYQIKILVDNEIFDASSMR